MKTSCEFGYRGAEMRRLEHVSGSSCSGNGSLVFGTGGDKRVTRVVEAGLGWASKIIVGHRRNELSPKAERKFPLDGAPGPGFPWDSSIALRIVGVFMGGLNAFTSGRPTTRNLPAIERSEMNA